MNKSPLVISGTQQFMLQFMIFGGTSFFLYPFFIIQATGQSYWMPIVIWMMIGIGGSWLFSKMLVLHPQKDAFAIMKQQYRFVGVVLFILPLLCFVLSSIVLMIRAHAEMISMTMLPATPQWFLNGIIVFISVFLGAGGLISIVRTAGVFMLIGVPLSVVLTLLGFSDIHLQLGRPWLYSDGDFIMHKDFYASSYIWTGFIYLAVAGKYVNKPKKLWRNYAAAALFFFPFILGAVYFPILTFGPEMTGSLTFPYLSKMDSVSHYWLVVEDLTSVFVAVSMLYVILTIALMMNCFVVGIRTIFPKWNERWCFVITAILTYGLAVIIPSWNMIEHAVIWATPLRLYVILVIPLAILMRGSRIQREGSRQ